MQPNFWSLACSSPTPSFLCLLQLLTPFRLKTADSPSLHIPHSNHTSLFSLTLHQSPCSFTVFFKLFRPLPDSISQTWKAVVTAHKLKSLCSYFNQKHISPTISPHSPPNSAPCVLLSRSDKCSPHSFILNARRDTRCFRCLTAAMPKISQCSTELCEKLLTRV